MRREPVRAAGINRIRRPGHCRRATGGRDLVTRLRAGGHLIFIRHAATEATQDDPRPDLADPSTQRNLTDDGREQARQLGRAIRRLRVPVGTVLAKPLHPDPGNRGGWPLVGIACV